MTLHGNHGSHWLIFLLPISEATFIPNLQFLAGSRGGSQREKYFLNLSIPFSFLILSQSENRIKKSIKKWSPWQ